MKNKILAIVIALMWIIMIIEAIFIFNTYRDRNNRPIRYFSNMSAQEKEVYNKPFKEYMKRNRNGEEIKELIDLAIMYNDENVNHSRKFISITPVNFSNLNSMNSESEIANGKSIGIAGDPEKNEDTVLMHSNTMKKLRLYVDIEKTYKIEATYLEDLIIGLVITEL